MDTAQHIGSYGPGTLAQKEKAWPEHHPRVFVVVGAWLPCCTSVNAPFFRRLSCKWSCFFFCSLFSTALPTRRNVRIMEHFIRIVAIEMLRFHSACDRDSQCGDNSFCNDEALCQCDVGYFTPEGSATDCRSVDGKLTAYLKLLLALTWDTYLYTEPDQACSSYSSECIFCGRSYTGPCFKYVIITMRSEC